MGYPQKTIHWMPGYRIVPTRFPSIYLFDRVASRKDFDALNLLESLTNPRIRDEIGELDLVPEAEKKFGPGTGPIMASFTHLNPEGSRFSDGSYGVFYAAQEKETAIAETYHHSSRFLAATNEQAMHLQMRLYTVEVQGDVVDLMQHEHADLLSKTSYVYSQMIGKRVKEQGMNGIVYPSVRNPSGTCVAALKTTILQNCFHAAYLEYHWDGQSINYVTQKFD